MISTIISLIIVGFFLYGFYHDGIIDKLENKKLKDLTLNDLVSIVFGVLLLIAFFKLLTDLF